MGTATTELQEEGYKLMGAAFDAHCPHVGRLPR